MSRAVVVIVAQRPQQPAGDQPADRDRERTRTTAMATRPTGTWWVVVPTKHGWAALGTNGRRPGWSAGSALMSCSCDQAALHERSTPASRTPAATQKKPP